MLNTAKNNFFTYSIFVFRSVTSNFVLIFREVHVFSTFDVQQPLFLVMVFGNIYKPKIVFVFSIIKIPFGTFRNNFLLFLLRILISKQIAPASLFSFPLRIKTPLRKNIKDDSVIFFTEVKCIGNTQIIHMEET